MLLFWCPAHAGVARGCRRLSEFGELPDAMWWRLGLVVGSGVVGVVWGVGVCGGQGVNWGIFSVLPRDVSVGSSVRRDVDERVGDGVVYGH